MNLFEQIQYSQNWNICFCTLSEEELIANKGIDGVQWLNTHIKTVGLQILLSFL